MQAPLPSSSGGSSHDVLVTGALSQIKRAAETARSTVGGLAASNLSDPSSIDRLTAAAGQLALVRSAVTESNLRYQAVHPIFVPGRAADLTDFLTTAKPREALSDDAAAEKRGRASAVSSHDHNALMEQARTQYDRQAYEAVNEFRARHQEKMQQLVQRVAEKKLVAMMAATAGSAE
jgi:hypothetical protein